MFGWFEDDGAAILEPRALSHVSASLSGAQAIAAVLMQAALGRTEDAADSRLKLCSNVEQGLIAALASCLEVVEVHALGTGACWTTQAQDGTEEEQAIKEALRSIAVAKFCKTARGAA